MTGQIDLRFGGSTYDPILDGSRLGHQLERVRDLMLDGRWRTLCQIEVTTGFPQASISARLRDLRKQKFGGYLVHRERVPNANGLYRYRMTERPKP